MFVIPCKFDRRRPMVFRCIKSIRRHHPSDEVVVVDADSEDKSYFSRIKKFSNTRVLNVGNRNYVLGALWQALEAYQCAFVYLLHDSMVLKSNISFLEYHDVTSIRSFRSWLGVGLCPSEEPGRNTTRYGYDNEEQMGWSLDHFERIEFRHELSVFDGVFGCSFAAHASVLDGLRGRGFHRMLPENKWQDQAMERNLGILLNTLGYDHAAHSLMGEHHANPMENAYIKKTLAGRQ